MKKNELKNKTYNDLINRYGEEKQLIVAIEELSELTKELTKILRGKGNKTRLVEEIADCYICLEQIRIIKKITNNELKNEKAKKLSRARKEYLLKWF